MLLDRSNSGDLKWHETGGIIYTCNVRNLPLFKIDTANSTIRTTSEYNGSIPRSMSFDFTNNPLTITNGVTVKFSIKKPPSGWPTNKSVTWSVHEGNSATLWNNNNPPAFFCEGPYGTSTATNQTMYQTIKNNQQLYLNWFMQNVFNAQTNFYDTWKHFTFTVDKSTKKARMAIQNEDYTLNGSTQITGNYNFNDITFNGIVYMAVGGQETANSSLTPAGNNRHWTGYIKDIYIGPYETPPG